MNLAEFADENRLHLRRDECDEQIIPGRQGQIYRYDDGSLGVMFMPPKTKQEPWGRWQPKRWTYYKKLAAKLGMIRIQNGDSEGCHTFDPANREEVRLALRIAGIKRKRLMSPKQAEHAFKALTKARHKALNGLKTV